MGGGGGEEVDEGGAEGVDWGRGGWGGRGRGEGEREEEAD